MRAPLLLKQNIDALLRGRHQTRKELAVWCYRGESWISKIFSDPNKEFSLKYLDRIADFFGLATYQLFQPGISSVTERRRGDRRAGGDRRVGTAGRLAASIAAALPVAPQKGRRGPQVVTVSPLVEELRRLTIEHERRISALLSQAESGGQTPTARHALPAAPARRRTVRGSDPATPRPD